ncbi:MAG: hypothetical protein RML72_01925 [Bacteroidia bacterium]|nr:Plug and carboxypeptidase regulatory-like domain-containing protein [Bacteroidia bacterium]MDW8157619.1 hypothetical protein [Bacteroidia bacterium]
MLKGRLVEESIKKPIAEATLLFEGEKEIYRALTDSQGEFNVMLPYGRYRCQIQKKGYYFTQNYDILVTSVQSRFLEFEAASIVYQLPFISIWGDSCPKEIAQAEISQRKIDPEETARWAGTLYDPLRAASYWAGISFLSDDHNDIIIRGRSPLGLLWRIEGIDIPNPNHFQNSLSNGGPISFINNNLLESITLCTGSLSARYGNVLSGAVDISFRKPNLYRAGGMFMLSAGGLEGMLELPLSVNRGVGLIASYRYSTLALLDKLGVKAGDLVGIPVFQDFTFKIDLLKTQNYGRWSLFGIWAQSENNMQESKLTKSAFWDRKNVLFFKDVYKNALRFLLGLKNEYLSPRGWLWQTSIGYHQMQNRAQVDTLSLEQAPLYQLHATHRNLHTITFHPNVRYQTTKKITFEAGAILDALHYAANDSWQIQAPAVRYNQFESTSFLFRSYGQISFFLAKGIQLELGTHLLYFTFNQHINWDLRNKWIFRANEKNAFSIFIGTYSQVLPLEVLYWQGKNQEFIYRKSKNLRSQEFIFSYSTQIAKHIFLRNEIFGNYSFNYYLSPPTTTFSSFNWGQSQNPIFWLEDNYTQEGKGYCWGWDMSLERKIAQYYYFLINATVLQSKYLGANKQSYPSIFQRTFFANALGGVEMPLGLKRCLTLLADVRLGIGQGSRYTPVDYLASMVENRTVYNLTFSNQGVGELYFRLDAQLGLRINQRSIAHQFYIIFQNITNHINTGIQLFDVRYKVVQFQKQLGFFPLLFYKLNF